MIAKYLHKINSLFYPFDKTIEIVITSENETVCKHFVDMCKKHFTDSNLLQHGLFHKYESDTFSIKIDKQTFVNFRFSCRTLSREDWQYNWRNADFSGDILVPIFRLGKYQPYDYANCLKHEIETFLGKVQKYGTTAITVLCNSERTINNNAQWENTMNDNCSFFCYNETSGFFFGQETFFRILLLRILSFDKLSTYKLK